MEVADLILNDVLAQFYKGYHLSKEKQEARIKKVGECNHVFVCTEIDELSPVIECVHCGLSNRTLNYYHKFMKYADKNKLKHIADNFPFEAKLFIDYLPSFLSNKEVNQFVFLSDEVLRTYHASILYQAAREIDGEADYEIIFQIMKKLNSLETDFERVKIEKKEDTYELISRYIRCNYEGKVKTYKK